MLENDDFLLPEEIKRKNEAIFRENNRAYLLLGGGQEEREADDYLEFDPVTGTYKNVQVDDSFVAIENHPEFVNVLLRLPTYELESIKRGLKQVIELRLRKDEIEKMRELISKYDEVVCYTDGCSLNNPGLSGAGVVFAGRNPQSEGI